MKVAPDPNPNFEELTILVNDIVKPDTEREFLNPPNLLEFLSPDLIHYYTYNGSLTTPPCSEGVTWIDFATPISISSNQVSLRTKYTKLNQQCKILKKFVYITHQCASILRK